MKIFFCQCKILTCIIYLLKHIYIWCLRNFNANMTLRGVNIKIDMMHCVQPWYAIYVNGMLIYAISCGFHFFNKKNSKWHGKRCQKLLCCTYLHPYLHLERKFVTRNKVMPQWQYLHCAHVLLLNTLAWI